MTIDANTPQTKINVDHERMFQGRKARKIIAWLNANMPPSTDEAKFDAVRGWGSFEREHVAMAALDHGGASDGTWSIVLGLLIP